MADLVRIAVFYDGSYMNHVSNFYKFSHPRQRRISIQGVHNYVRLLVADLERTSEKLCQIVEAHYFRGRFSARDLDNMARGANFASDALRNDRAFDQILADANVTTHFVKMDTQQDPPKEQGIDVWLAIEALDLAVNDRCDVVVLIACDGDFVPLVRKLNSYSKRVVLLGWAVGDTKVSWPLIKAASHPIDMANAIDRPTAESAAAVDSLFVD